MSRVGFVFAALIAACASAPPKPVPVTVAPAHPSGIVVQAYDPNAVETVVPAVEKVPRRFEEEPPPPARRHHQKIVTRRAYRRLVRAHPLGFGPVDCVELCGDAAFEPAGRWTWVLRCKLAKAFTGEPAVACEQDAVDDHELARIRARWNIDSLSAGAR